MRIQTVFVALLAFGLAAPLAAGPVALELSLVIDVSGSIDTTEYNLQRAAYAGAFNLPSIQATIAGLNGGVAINVIQFDSSSFTALPWTLLTDNASVSAFASSLASMPRQGSNGGTNIIAGMNASLASFAANSYQGSRMVMDVSGDGEQNQQGCQSSDTVCAALQAVRDNAATAGITVNGLPILASAPGLAAYYQSNVITPGGFLKVSADFASFEAAIGSKLYQEISGQAPPNGDVPEPGTAALLGLGLAALVAVRNAAKVERQKPQVRAGFRRYGV